MKSLFKRLLSLCLCLVLVAVALPVSPAEAAENDPLEHLSYTISDGAVTITDCDAFIKGCLIIPDTIEGFPVTKIGSAAFSYCNELSKVTLSNQLKTIGAYAFSSCPLLTELIIPASVTRIEQYGLGGINDGYNIVFLGDPPKFAPLTFDTQYGSFYDVTVYYPLHNPKWTDNVMANVSGVHCFLSWKAQHSWDAGTPIISSTCTTAGIYRYACTGCSQTKTETVSALGHQWGKGIQITALTCTTDGAYRYTCSGCDKTRTETFPATGHQFEDGSCIHCGEPEAVSLPGDVNGDGKVNIMDVAKLYAHIKGTLLIEDETQLRQADLTGDGNVNILDIAKLYASVKGTE